MSLSELMTTKASGGTHTQSVKNGIFGSNRAFPESEVPLKQASFKDLILAAEIIESTVENTPHDQNQESEGAHNQMDGDKIVANLTHFTTEPFVGDAKSAREQENSDHNGAGSEPLATEQVAIQDDIQHIESREVSQKVVVETTGYVQVGNQEKTAIPIQNKGQAQTQIQGHSQAQTQIQGQAKKSIQPQPSELTQAISRAQKSHYISESQQGESTISPKSADSLHYTSIHEKPSDHSLIKDNSLSSLNVMGSSGSLVPSRDINSMVSRIVSPLESNQAKVIQQKVVLPVSDTQENTALTKQHGLSLMTGKSIDVSFSSLQNGQTQIPKLPQAAVETLGKVSLLNTEEVIATESSKTAKAAQGTIAAKVPDSTQGYLPSVRTIQESIQSTLHSQQTTQGPINEPAEKQSQLGQQVITAEKNSPSSEGNKSLGESHTSRNQATQKEGISDWVSKITKPLEAESTLSQKGTSTEKGAQIHQPERIQMGSTINFSVAPEMVVPNGQKDEWTGEQNIEEWLSSSTQTNGKTPEVELAAAQKRSASPIFLQQMRKIVEQKEMGQGLWTKHSFALEDGEQVQISTRKVDGQVQIKVLASQNELQRVLFQQSGQLRDLLQKDYNVEVEFEFSGQESFAEQEASDFGEQSSNGRSRSFERTQLGESGAAEQVQSSPKKGFNNNEWRG